MCYINHSSAAVLHNKVNKKRKFMEDLLQQGITAYKEGKRDEARNIFITVVKQSPDSQSAWAWLYDASNNDQERIH